jgi:hypothetical protein
MNQETFKVTLTSTVPGEIGVVAFAESVAAAMATGG